MKEKQQKNTKKVMVFGTFDGLHEGHIDLFKQSRALAKNPSLIVSIARDLNVLKIKGMLPSLNEKERKRLLEQCSLVDKVVLSGKSKHIPHILKERPEIIALGYDQSAYVENLKKDLKDAGLKVKVTRLNPYKEHIYKNSLLKKKRII